MRSQGVRPLDVGTGHGLSAFVTHDFYAATVRCTEISGSERWRQPAQLTCVERKGGMNPLRHHLAETLHWLGAPRRVLSISGHLPDFQSTQSTHERKELDCQLRNAHDDYYDHCLDQWESERLYTPEEANRIANAQHRCRLFPFTNFLTTCSTPDAGWRNSWSTALADMM